MKFVRHQDDLTCERVELALGDLLGEVDHHRGVVDHAAPADVTAHDADDAIVDRLVVGDHFRIRFQQSLNLAVERLQPFAKIVDSREGAVQVRHVQFFVVVQVVRCRNDADDTTEAVLAQPDDFFLPAHPTMVVAAAAGSLAHCEFVFHEPGEVARISRWATESLFPTLTIVMDVSAEVGLSRLKKKDRLEAEPLAFHERIRQEFLQISLLDPERYLVIDGQMNVEDIHTAIITRVAELPELSKIPKKPKLITRALKRKPKAQE